MSRLGDNLENKMVIDSLWPAEHPVPRPSCDFCGHEYDERAFEGCCLMCYARAKSALDKYLADGTPTTKTDREVMAAWLTTV